MIITMALTEHEVEVEPVGEKVAYSWTCGLEHVHTIDCLWVWHDCDLSRRPTDDHWTSVYKGWKPSGVGLHTLVNIDPLHIEASVYWPDCCGLHGWIRNGTWIDA